MGEFSVSFRNNEEEFIMNYGVNTGYSRSFSKVNRCLFLSSEAKQLYNNVCNYAYGERRKCFPSQAVLRLELGWQREKMQRYLKELETKGFIRREYRGANLTLTYIIEELRNNPWIIHSEIVHEVKPRGTKEVDGFMKLLTEYQKTELYKEINFTKKPELYVGAIVDWFTSRKSDSTEPMEEVIKLVTPAEEPKSPVHGVRVIRTEGIEVGSEDSRKRAKKKVDLNDPTDVWNAHYFLKYFTELFQRNTKKPYMSKDKEDLGALKRVMDKHDSKEQVRQYMDIYFEHSEEFGTHSVLGFCSTFTQNSISNYLTYGKFNSYKNGVGKPQEEVIPQQVDDDEDSLENILRKKGL